MADKTLDDLFHDTLKDIYYAERKILKSLPKMARAAQHPQLKAAFEKHKDQTEGQIERLQQVFEIIGKAPRGKTCDAIEGILAEGDEIMEEYKGTPALDAGLLAAAQAVEHYEITRYGTLGRVPVPFLLRSDNGLVFTSRHYTRLVRSYGLKQEFITPHCPQQNGMVERVIRTLKEQCAHRHRFESQQHAMRVIGDWIAFYNHRRPHQALGMKTPAEAYALAA